MTCELLREKRAGTLWVLAPEESIQFSTSTGGRYGVSFFASRTDDTRKFALGGEITSLEYLRRTTVSLGEIVIPLEIISFAHFWIKTWTGMLVEDLSQIMSDVEDGAPSAKAPPHSQKIPWARDLSDQGLFYMEYLVAQELKRLIEAHGGPK